MKKIASLSFAIISVLSIVSCSDDDNALDTTKPTIEIVTPTDDQDIEPGSSFAFKANLSDDSGLASYHAEVHSAADGHTHKPMATEAAGNPFIFNDTQDVPGQAKNYTVEETINIPEGVQEGPYHVGITVLDTFGNQNQQFIEVHIGHDEDHEH